MILGSVRLAMPTMHSLHAYTSRIFQAIFPKIQEFVDDFHAGKAAGHNENAAANKPVVKDHNTAQKTAAAAPGAKKVSPSTEPSKKPPAASSVGAVKRGSHRIEFKETFYCCALLPAIRTISFQQHVHLSLIHI